MYLAPMRFVTLSFGESPQEFDVRSKSALKARFTADTSSIHVELKRAFSAS
jgi:hypothetical protein